MTAADHTITSSASIEQASGRWSDRVALGGHQPTEGVGLGRISAPECSALAGTALPPAERAAPNAATGSQRRHSRGQAERIGRGLSDRDRAILASLQAHHFLTTEQLQRFHFAEHATSAAAARICRRVLHRLHQLHVIDHLERRVGGVRAGSASYVWRVGLVGDQLLRLRAGGDQPRLRRKEPSLRYLEHCLAIADCHLMLRDLATANRIELLGVDTEPDCWRSYLALSGSRDTLKPDLYAVTAAGDYEDHWYIEVDRATESLPTLLRKCGQYEDYRRTGTEQHLRGIFPLVVWIVPDQARTAKLAGAITASRSLDSGLYRICTSADFAEVITGGAA
jgi:hypothetical protein